MPIYNPSQTSRSLVNCGAGAPGYFAKSPIKNRRGGNIAKCSPTSAYSSMSLPANRAALCLIVRRLQLTSRVQVGRRSTDRLIVRRHPRKTSGLSSILRVLDAQRRRLERQQVSRTHLLIHRDMQLVTRDAHVAGTARNICAKCQLSLSLGILSPTDAIRFCFGPRRLCPPRVEPVTP
jgi:hypothetical protein